LYTDFEPYDANRLFPHFDQPDLKARYTLSVQAPANWQVVSTMRETATRVDGATRFWTFPPTEPLSSYVFSLHAGEYAVIEEPEPFRYPLRLFIRHSLKQYLETDFWFATTRQGFDFFDEYFGLPYPFQKYDQLIVPDYISGAMENVAAVTFNESFLQRRASTRSERFSLASVIMHEMAHMWFGDITTMAWWNGLWLNESFATYMASLAMEGGTDFDEVWHRFFLRSKQSAYFADQLVTTHPIELPVRNTAEATSNFDSITYGKGASSLKQLAFLLGPDVFRQGVRDYLASNAWDNTELEDFMGAMAAAAARDLDDWTQTWLYQAGVNSIELELQCEADRLTSIKLLQSAPDDQPTLREQRMRIAFYGLQDGALAPQGAVDAIYRGASTAIPVPEGQACPDLAYPNADDHGYAKINLDKRSLETLKSAIMTLDDPLLRSMLWNDLDNMVQNAELPLTAFLDILATNLTAETDLTATIDLLYLVRGGFAYLHQVPAAADLLVEYAARFENILWQQVQQTQGDARQIWLSAYIDTANNATAWSRIGKLLSGDISLPDYDLDQDTRWRIVHKLSEFRQPGYAELVAAEADADSSSLGIENAVRAQVLAARGEEKLAWFEKAMAADENYKLRRSRTIRSALFPYSSQRQLAAPFAEQMVEALPQISAAHDSTFHFKVTQYSMPRLCSVENAERLRTAAARYPELDPAIIKGLKRSAQLDERCAGVAELLQPTS
ncbi:MAG: aminopeptidase N, partial [Pseudomonadota bacterium]